MAIYFPLTEKFIYAIMILVVFFIIMGSGGIQFLTKIPIWVWAIFLILFLFAGRRRR